MRYLIRYMRGNDDGTPRTMTTVTVVARAESMAEYFAWEYWDTLTRCTGASLPDAIEIIPIEGE